MIEEIVTKVFKIYQGSERDNWRWGDERYRNKEEYWKIKNFRLFSGYLSGNFERGYYQKQEKAVADRYRIFFKNGTFDLDKPSCSWVNQLPQGFSCVRGTKSIQECDGFSESFVRVPCNEIIVKVAQFKDCRGMVRYSDCYNMDTFDDKDCFAGVMMS